MYSSDLREVQVQVRTRGTQPICFIFLDDFEFERLDKPE